MAETAGAADAAVPQKAAPNKTAADVTLINEDSSLTRQATLPQVMRQGDGAESRGAGRGREMGREHHALHFGNT
jgi:hypothetical protein